MSENTAMNEHAWVHENLAAYLAGGLDAAQRQRLDAHINGCPECFDAFTEARDADRALQRTLGVLAPLELAGGGGGGGGVGKFEDQVVTHFRERSMNGWKHPAIRRVMYATAACAALAATGVFANFAIHQGGRFSNPLSERLVAQADQDAPDLGKPMEQFRQVVKMKAPTSLPITGEARGGPPGKMVFNYTATPVDTILTDISRQLGIIVIQTTRISTPITVQNPAPLNAEAAFKQINDLLYPLGYTAVTNTTTDGHTVVRVLTVAEAKKAQVPVFFGSDPDKIPLDDTLITQVIPVQNIAPGQLSKDLLPFMSADANIDFTSNGRSNSIVVTDTSAKINRLAQVVRKLDEQGQNNGRITGLAASVTSNLNSQNLNIEKKPLAEGTLGVRDASREYESIQHLNGQEGMAQNIDSAEHLTPYTDLMVRPDNMALDTEKELAMKGVGVGVGGRGPAVALGLEGTARQPGAQAGGQPSSAAEANAPVLSLGGFSEPTPGIGAGHQAYKDLNVSGDAYYARDNNMYWKDANNPSGSGSHVKSGGGVLTMSGLVNSDSDAEKNLAVTNGVNTYTGSTIVTGGTLGLNSGTISTIAGRDSLAVNGGDILRIGGNSIGSSTFAGNIAGAGTVTLGKAIGGRDNAPAINLAGGNVAIGQFTRLETNGTGLFDANGNATSSGASSGGLPADSSKGQGSILTGGGTISGGTLALGRVGTEYGVTSGQAAGTTISGAATLMANGSSSANHLFGNAAGQGQGAGQGNGQNVGSGDAHSDFPRQVALGELPTLTAIDFKNSTIGGLDAQLDGKWTKPDNKVVYEVQDMLLQRNDMVIAPQLALATPQGAPGSTGTGTSTGTRPAPAVSSPAAVEAAASLKIIKNGTIAFEVSSFDDAYRTVNAIAGEEHGFVSATSSEKLANGHVRGTIVVRVPPERLDFFLLKIRALGDLKAQQIGAADITKQYTDIESELSGLRTMEGRLIDLIKNGKGEVKDLVAAEQQLGDYRVRIEKLEGEKRYYNNLVSLATITITAYEKDIAGPTAASEQEVVNVNVETEEVESKYQAARKVFDDAKGRIVESQLKNTDAEHVAAHIVADVPPEQADFVAGQLKQLGKVASFNRDRRQTTTGGTGAPNVQVEHKDTRFTIDLFNLANLAPRETTVMRVAVRDVEGTYKTVLGLVKQTAEAPLPPAPPAGAAPAAEAPAKVTGRVLSSNLTGQLPEQMAADIRAEIRAETADAVLAAIRGSGEVLASSLATNADNANTTGAKRGIQLTLVNIAAVAPKEADTVNVAVRDVDAAYKAALALIRKDAPPTATAAATAPGAALLPPTMGRILSSNMNGTQPAQMTADIRAEIRTDQSDAVLAAIKGAGEVLNSSVTESPEQINITRVKRGLVVRFINVAAVAPREVREMRGIAASVQSAHEKLLSALQDLAAKGDVRIIGSGLRDADPRSVSANFSFEARREALASVEAAFTAAGVEFPARTITRSTDTTNTLDSKVLFQISEIRSAESMEPRRTITLGEEVENVDKAKADLLKALRAMSDGSYKEVDFNESRDQSGRVTAHWTLDMPMKHTFDVQNAIRGLGGIEKNNQETRNTQVPETTLAKERIDLTLYSRQGIVESDKGFGQTIRAALSSAAGALLYSVYLVLTGVLFAAPFLLIVWPVYAMIRRKKATVKA